MTQNQFLTVIAVFVLAAIGLSIGIGLNNRTAIEKQIATRSVVGRQRAQDTALALYQTCRQVEVVKTAIRGTLMRSIPQTEALRGIPGFGAAEKAKAVASTKREIATFAAVDCLKTPSAHLLPLAILHPGR